MDTDFTPHESHALYRLLAEQTSDIVLKTDRRGFIVHASADLEQFGFPPEGGLIGRHLVDLAHSAFSGAVEAALAAVITGQVAAAGAEFPARTRGGDEPWFDLRLRGLTSDPGGETYGTVAILRSVEEKRLLEEELFNAAMTDPLTGCTNRRAFTMMLQHLLDKQTGGCLAIFSVDYFKAMNMEHGQAFGDEVLVVFAGLLRSLMRADDTLSRIGSESIAVLLPAATPDQAEVMCRRVIATLAEIRRAAGPGGVAITASVGVSRIQGTLDDTIKRAELALFMARAKGRDRLEMDDGRKLPAKAIKKSLSA